MDLSRAFDQVKQDFPGFRKLVVQARGLTDSPGTRDQLDHLLGEMDKAYAEVERTFPAAAAAVKSSLEATQRINAQTQRELDSARSALESAKAKVLADRAAQAAEAGGPAGSPLASPVAPSIPPVDANLARSLRDELLAKFADLQSRRRRRPIYDDGEAWQDLDDA